MTNDLSAQRFWGSPAAAGPDGLVGVGGDLSPATLVRAYADGVFPWFNPGDPILWWSPDPRGIFEFDGIHVSKSLARTLKAGRFTTTVNAAFRQVMEGCAAGRQQGTWITRRMLTAYGDLHTAGAAHSIEVWQPTTAGGRELVGGIYGVAVGAMFAGESMFHRVTDASKVALVTLGQHLQQRGYTLFDTQMVTAHTTRMGAIEISRSEYLARLAAAVATPGVTFG